MAVIYGFSALLAVYVLCLTIVTTYGCSCVGPKTLQEHYCKAGFVIKAKILDRTEIFDKSWMPNIPKAIRFRTKTLKVFKLDETVETKVNIHEVYTGSSSCGLQYNVGKVYIIAGRLRSNGEQWAEVCEFAMPWSDLSPQQVKYIKWKYRKHCDCTVKITDKRSAQHCTTTMNQWLCYAKHSYCEERALKQRNACRWQMNKPLRDCLRKLEP